jgi:hypothetical protein
VAATFEYYPFDSGPGSEAKETQWRDMAETWLSTGIIMQGIGMDTSGGDCAVTPGTGLQISIAPGKAWVKGHFFKHTGDPALLSIEPNTSGSTRNDLVVIRNDFTANEISYQILTGSTTPTQNATTWELPIAQLSVPNNASSITSSNITDKRVSANHFMMTPAAQLTNSADIPVAADATITLTWNTERFDNMGMHSLSTNTDRITIMEPGIYQVTAMVYWARPNSGLLINGQMEMSVYQNRSGTVRQFIRDSRYISLSNGVQSASQIIDLQAGDYLYVQVSNKTSHTDLKIDAAQPYSPYFSVVKLGTVSGL